MRSPITECPVHIAPCECEAKKLAVLIKAALDAAVLLDEIKDHLEGISYADAASRIAERIHTACEALQPPLEIPA